MVLSSKDTVHFSARHTSLTITSKAAEVEHNRDLKGQRKRIQQSIEREFLRLPETPNSGQL